jgi:two-component system cell cycle sensor histidine kinase/response regulator CckA
VTTLLRVLIVEDSEDDAQLVLRQLRSGGYELKWERVETAEAMSSALAREQWDVILCDYRMPNFSAPAALKLIHDKGMDLPFIIVSGTIGEDTAVAAMKSGAHDYLMKDKLARLVVAVEREIRDANIRREKKKTEEELQRSEQSFRSISENAHDGIIVALRNGAYIFANRRVTEITGYAINEILKIGIEGIARPDESLRLSERRKKILAGENVPNQYETVIIHKGGKSVPIEITSAKTLWFGQVADIFVFRDITERKQAEEALRKSEENFHRSLSDSPLGIRIVSADGKTLYANQAILDIYGYDSIEELRTTSHKKIYTPQSYDEYLVRKEQRQRGEYVASNYEVSIIRKDGETRHLDVERRDTVPGALL